MKLLKEGEAFKPFEHECAQCASLLLVEKSDLICWYYAGDHRERSETTYGATYCYCSTPFVIRNDKIPLGLRNRMLKEKRGY